jgi:Flp pilus assembly pilin Flp
MVRAVRTLSPSLWWWLIRPRRGPTAIEYAWIVAVVAFLGTTTVTFGNDLTLVMRTIADRLVGIHPAPLP